MDADQLIKILKPVGTFLVAAYAVVLVLMFVFQRSFMYFPNNAYATPIEAGLTAYQDIVLETNDGLTLGSWYLPPPQEDAPVIVFMHGNGLGLVNRRAYFDTMQRLGFGVLALEYRRYSGNPGSPHEEGLYIDARAALAFVADQEIALTRVILMGVSLGTGVAVQMATEVDARALVLVSPYTSIPDVAAEHYGYLPVHTLLRDRYASIDKVEQVAEPVTIFHGARDTLIPIAFGQTLYEALPGEKLFFTQEARGHRMDMDAVLFKVKEVHG